DRRAHAIDADIGRTETEIVALAAIVATIVPIGVPDLDAVGGVAIAIAARHQFRMLHRAGYFDPTFSLLRLPQRPQAHADENGRPDQDERHQEEDRTASAELVGACHAVSVEAPP